MADDPVLERRRRVAVATSIAKRLGYLLFAAAMVLFVLGFIAGFTDGVVSVIVACLVIGSIVLAPAIVFSYAVRAADREDRERAAEQRGES